MKININILTSTRSHYLDLIVYFLNKIKPENKNKIKVNILISEGFDNIIDNANNAALKLIDIEHEVISDYYDYMAKTKFCVNQDAEYSIKHDEDVFLSNYLYDYIIENVHILEDDNNLLLTPLISNGIPSIDTFINDFFDEQHQSEFLNYFKNTSFFPLWGADYTFLNNQTILSDSFNSTSFYESVSNYNHPYKGIHPVRINSQAQIHMLNLLLTEKYINKFLQPQNYEVMDIQAPYLCNNVFAIKTNKWKEIVDTPSLFVDAFDEVPISVYKQKTNKKFVFIKNGFAVHTLYNTISSPQNHQIEMSFYESFKNKIYQTHI